MNAKKQTPADDLEALFDSIVAGGEVRQAEAAVTAKAAPAAAAPSPAAPVAAEPVCAPIDELEALFDQVAAERVQQESAPAAGATTARLAPDAEEPSGHMFARVGQLTRTLHDALRELGYDKKIASAANSLPDARDRLAYIASLTGRAAERVLGAVEAGQDAQRKVETGSRELRARWGRLYARDLSVDEFRILSGDTHAFLASLAGHAEETNRHLHEIMMAQDFHDLTGQVIKRVVELAATLETSLVTLLVETQQGDHKTDEGWLSGPAMNKESNPDVVKDQEQVDSLLESLGF